jgi:hypothetical protein
VFQDLYDAYGYYQDPGAHFLLQTADTTLADFGAGWLYMRYLVDQFGPGLPLRLEETTLTGTDNVAAQTGLPFETTATRWAMANWVSDLPGFSPPPGFFYRSWSFRATFASLNAQDPYDFPSAFPLVPLAAPGSGVSTSGELHAGSGYYVDVVQRPGAAAFTLRFDGGSAPLAPALDARLDVVRIR